MSNYVDTKALRAHANGMRNLRFYVFDLDPDDDNDQRVFARDEDGDVHLVEEMPRKAKEAICALVNAAPALLDELDMRRQQVDDMSEDQGKIELRAETAEAECERLKARVQSIASSVEHHVKTACAKVEKERDALRAENERLRKTVGRLHKITSDSYMLLPIVPGDAMAFADGNLTPHVMRVADEFAVRTEQLAAERREVERLRAEVEAHRRLRTDKYRDWCSAGGRVDNQCKHGVDTTRFNCRRCDESLVDAALAAQERKA